MATDFFIAAVWMPTLGIILALTLIRIFGPKKWLNTNVFSITWGRLLSGLLGALVGLYVYSAVFSYVEAIDRVAGNESLQETGALSLAFGWSIYFFILFAPFFLAAFGVLFVPILALLSRMRLVSNLGVLLIMLIFAGVNAGSTCASPGNNWCEANLASCVRRSALGALKFAFPAAMGFAIGARLPFFVSRRNLR